MLNWLYTKAPARAKIKVAMLIMEAFLLLQMIVGVSEFFLHKSAPQIFVGEMSTLAVEQIVLLVIWAVMTKIITIPLETLASLGESLGRGDIPKEIPYVDNADCAGRLARILSSFSERVRQGKINEDKTRVVAQKAEADAEKIRIRDETTRKVVKAVGEAQEKLSNGDLTVRLNDPIFDGEFSGLRDSFNSTAKYLQMLWPRYRQVLNLSLMGHQKYQLLLMTWHSAPRGRHQVWGRFPLRLMKSVPALMRLPRRALGLWKRRSRRHKKFVKHRMGCAGLLRL